MSAHQNTFFKYLDEHQEDIKYARRGYIMRLSEAFKEESGVKLSYSQVRRLLMAYRIDRNFKLQYCPHTYYRPVVERKNPTVLNPYGPVEVQS